jgi:hypothetical protein
MKKHCLLVVCLISLSLYAFDCQSFGPEGVLFTANFDQHPISMAGAVNDQNQLYVFGETDWETYPLFPFTLPVTSIYNLNENIIMVTMGMMTYSDGLYNYDLTTHQSTINNWFMLPNFVRFNPANSTYYVGERDGLFKSTNADDWYRITTLGNSACTSMDYMNEYIVANNGQNVHYSSDAGQSWNLSEASNLKGFRYMSDGTLYAVMNNGSDSDGLWKSDDFGATWNDVYYTEGLSHVGPDYGERIPLGWNRPQGESQVGLWNTSTQQLTMLAHPSLCYPVLQLESLPLVNTPSFYVINTTGCHFVTDFLGVDTNDCLHTPPASPSLHIYPNPTPQSATIRYSVDNRSPVRIDIFNAKGQLVQSIHQGIKAAGDFTWEWNGQDSTGNKCPKGIYYVRVQTNQQTSSSKLVLLK